MFSPMFSCSKAIAYFTFLPYVLLGNELTAETVFVTLSLFGPVRFAMTFCLPFGIQLGSEATVTINRLEVSEWRIDRYFYSLNNMKKKHMEKLNC